MRDALDALSAELPRRLATGPAAAGPLRRHVAPLRQAGAQVPACARLADAVERAAGADGADAGTALLDLLGLVRQVAVSLAGSGIAGEMEALPPGGPWATPGEAVELAALVDVLGQSGSGREKALAKAVQQRTLADLRLVGPLLQGVEDRYAAFADLVADKALPALGPALAPELERRTDPEGGPVVVRCLRALCRVDAEAGPRRCRELLRGASEALRVQALESLAQVDAGRAVDDALPCLQDKSAKVRGAAYAVLAAAALAGSEPALEALLTGLGEPEATWQRLKPTLVVLKAPGLSQRLAAELEAMLAAQGGKAKAGVNRGTARRIACRLLEVLGERADRQGSLPLLLPLAREAPEALRAAAIRAAGKCGLEAEGVLEAVVAGLHDAAEAVAEAAVFALPWGGPEVPQAAPALREVIANLQFSGHVRYCALLAFGGVAPRDQASIDYLLGLLRAGGPNTAHCRAAEALATFGEAGRPALPALGELFLESPEWMLTYYLAAPLVALDPDGSFVVPLLIRVLTEPRYQPRRQAAFRALQRYGERARPAIPALEALAAHGPREETYPARYILAALGHSS
jgi:HEAT repeat protein